MLSKCGRAAAIAALIFLTLGARAEAGSLGIANDFNGFVFGNLTALGGQDTEGRLAVGGNFHATNYGVGDKLTNSGGTRDDLVVGGDMNAAGAWQVFFGNAVWGTSLTAAPTTPNGSTFQGTPVDFAAAEADLLAKSAYWGTLPANGTSVKMFSTLHITGTDPVLNVFHVDPGDWQSTSDKQLTIPVGSTALINVGGTSLNYSNGMALNGSSNPVGNPALPGVLFNFYEATTVQQSNMALLGSLLAPLADFTISGGAVNGVGVLANVIQTNGGEFHFHPFNGDLPDPLVPEPSAAAMLLLGAATLVVARTRR